AVAALEKRLFLRDDVPVFLKGCAGLATVHGLRPAQRILAKALEILGDPRREISPRFRVVPGAEHQGARLEPQEWRNRIPGGRGEGQRGDRMRRDLPVSG